MGRQTEEALSPKLVAPCSRSPCSKLDVANTTEAVLNGTHIATCSATSALTFGLVLATFVRIILS